MNMFEMNETYTPAAQQLGREIEELVGQIYDRWHKLGYSLRDIETVAREAVEVQATMRRLSKRGD